MKHCYKLPMENKHLVSTFTTVLVFSRILGGNCFTIYFTFEFV